MTSIEQSEELPPKMNGWYMVPVGQVFGRSPILWMNKMSQNLF